MSYQVLARKWRPRRFADLVGQEHVVRALSNALAGQRLHHAYLLTGTRGVGKTTIARILAKSLNCERGVGAEPCGECAACRQIDAGRFVDLLEIDAASNTGIDNIREVIENAQYAPTAGRYKVYIIDEVHMLSKSAFNAMLKTLEEPPAHVKFILATTDPQKVPVTVLSRCLQFALRNMTPQQVSGHLAHVLATEGIEFESPALALLARAASGSMRDALSLLDQAIAYGEGVVREDGVRAMLGAVDRRYLFTLLAALADGDGAAVLDEARELAARGIGFDAALEELAQLFYQIALMQAVPQAIADDEPEREALAALAGSMAPEDVQLYYQMAVQGGRDLPLAPDEQLGFNMALLRMLAFHPQTGSPALAAPAAAAGGIASPPQAPAGMTAGARPAAPAGTATDDDDDPASGRGAARAAIAKALRRSPAERPVVATRQAVPADTPVESGLPATTGTSRPGDTGQPASVPAGTTAPAPEPASASGLDSSLPWDDEVHDSLSAAPVEAVPAAGLGQASLPHEDAYDCPEREPAASTPEVPAGASPAGEAVRLASGPAEALPWDDETAHGLNADEQAAHDDMFGVPAEPAAVPVRGGERSGTRAPDVTPPADVRAPDVMPDAVAVPAESAEALAASGPVATGTGLTGDWIALVDTLKDSLGAKARLLAQNAELVAREGELVRLRLPGAHRFVAGADYRSALADALATHWRLPVRIEVEIGDVVGETHLMQRARVQGEKLELARSAIEQDPRVAELKREFGAVVVPESIQPLDEE